MLSFVRLFRTPGWAKVHRKEECSFRLPSASDHHVSDIVRIFGDLLKFTCLEIYSSHVTPSGFNDEKIENVISTGILEFFVPSRAGCPAKCLFERGWHYLSWIFRPTYMQLRYKTQPSLSFRT